jgi:hypothetical protein
MPVIMAGRWERGKGVATARLSNGESSVKSISQRRAGLAAMDQAKKKALIVLGYESSGSVFTARVASHVLGKCAWFGQWHGYGFNGAIGDDLVVLHRSIPWMRPKQWHEDPRELLEMFTGYDVRFVICTRDLSISHLSRIKRFGGSIADYQADSQRATALFTKIIETCPCFVFSYETMVALGQVYFQELYRWLGVKSDFQPEIKDANAAYVER